MSLRPNRRESSENAPGPRSKRAAVTQSENPHRNGSGSCGPSRMKNSNRAETLQVTGVSAPRQNAPASMNVPAISHLAIETVASAALL